MTLIVILSANISTAAAQPSERFPTSVTLMIDEERHEAFDFFGFVELLHIDEDLRAAEAANALLNIQMGELRLSLTSQQEAYAAAESQYQLCQAERARLFTMWEEENKLRHEAENEPSPMLWLGWASAGVLGALSIVLAVLVTRR